MMYAVSFVIGCIMAIILGMIFGFKRKIITNIGFDDGLIITKDGYNFCPVCKSKTILVIKDCVWDVDSEPYKSGEELKIGGEYKDDIPDTIETDIEISGQFCLECWKMRSLCIRRE